MRKIGLLLATASFYNTIQAHNTYGRSYFSGQPYYGYSDITASLLTDLHHNNGSVLKRPKCQATIFGGQSTNSEKLRDYFLFDGKSSLTMYEYSNTTPTELTRDIVGVDFNIQTTTEDSSSTITLKPQQTFFGFNLNYQFSLMNRLWATVSAPFVYIKNDLNLSETLIGTAKALDTTNKAFDEKLAVATNMISAFKQAGMAYGKIDGAQHKMGVGEMILKCGYNLVNQEKLYISPYAGIIISGSNKAKAIYMWEPITGNGGHHGITLGSTGSLCTYQIDDTKIWMNWHLEGNYLFQNTQMRSLDLKNGPWTRYLTMYASSADRTSTHFTMIERGIRTFGINLMTKPVHVKPGYNGLCDLNIALLNNKYAFKLGLSSQFKQSETVCLVTAWQQGPQMASLSADNYANPFRKSGRTFGGINYTVGGVAADIYITTNDIDFNSAAHPSVIAHTAYSSISMYRDTERPQLYELGTSYHFGHDNSAINHWGLWGKIQITF